MKSTRSVVVANDKLKEKLQKKSTHIKKIMAITTKITKLEEERKALLPEKEELEKIVKELAEKIDIKTSEGETVTAVDVIKNELTFTVTNNELFLKEVTQEQVDKLWDRCDEEIKKLSEKDGDK